MKYNQPISLILLAGNSVQENHQLRQSLYANEYVFAQATSIYHCLDIAECHHPKVVLIDFASLDKNYLPVIQLFQFLNIPLIIVGENLTDNNIRYLQKNGIFAALRKDGDELKLRHTLEKAIELRRREKVADIQSEKQFDLSAIASVKNTKLQDVVNTAIATAVGRLSEMIACEMEFDAPSFDALSPLILQNKLVKALGEKLVAVAQLDFTGNLSGSAQMLFTQEVADTIVASLCEEELSGEELNQMKADIMGEIGNVAINSIVGTFSNSLNYKLGYVVPTYVEGSTQEILAGMNLSQKSTVILFMSHFKMIQLHVEGEFVLLFQARLLLDMLFRV